MTLIRLAAKNAILIVEFCKLRYEQGEPLAKAPTEAAMMRLRPYINDFSGFYPWGNATYVLQRGGRRGTL